MMLDVVACALASYDWLFVRDEEHRTIDSTVRTDSGTFQLRFKSSDDNALLLFTVTAPNAIPVESRLVALEYLMNINWRLTVGGFVLDMRDGEVQFKIGYDTTDGSLSLKAVQRMLTLGIGLFDKYYMELLALCFHGVSPSKEHLNISPSV